jgi:uncharacterized membrane protein (UPF0127 family)
MLYVEMADTPDLQRQGLMFRKHLPENHGMLFKFNDPQILKFWGLNTYIPLDIAFVDADKTIIKIGRIKKMSMDGVSSENKAIMAVEANDGFFANNKIKVGDKIILAEENGKVIVRFAKNEKER